MASRAASYLFTEEEQQAYDELCGGMRESLNPVGEAQILLAQEICDDSWRLQRARNFESAIFADAVIGSSPIPKNPPVIAKSRYSRAFSRPQF
jgi:hypothetical protein